MVLETTSRSRSDATIVFLQLRPSIQEKLGLVLRKEVLKVAKKIQKTPGADFFEEDYQKALELFRPVLLKELQGAIPSDEIFSLMVETLFRTHAYQTGRLRKGNGEAENYK